MKITFSNASSASASEIEKIETLAGRRLPPEFLEFLKSYNGAEPEENVINLGEEDDLAINHFIPASQIPILLKHLELPPNSLPFARDSFGNYFFINTNEDQSVYFWDHEVDDAPIRLADSFSAFIDAIVPDKNYAESAAAVSDDLEEGGWKHPEFDKMFADYLIPKKDRND